MTSTTPRLLVAPSVTSPKSSAIVLTLNHEVKRIKKPWFAAKSTVEQWTKDQRKIASRAPRANDLQELSKQVCDDRNIVQKALYLTSCPSSMVFTRVVVTLSM